MSTYFMSFYIMNHLNLLKNISHILDESTIEYSTQCSDFCRSGDSQQPIHPCHDFSHRNNMITYTHIFEARRCRHFTSNAAFNSGETRCWISPKLNFLFWSDATSGDAFYSSFRLVSSRSTSTNVNNPTSYIRIHHRHQSPAAGSD